MDLNEDFGRLLTEDTVRAAKASVPMLGLSSLAAVCRLLLTDERRTFFWFLRMQILGGFAGTLTGLLLQYFSLPQPVIYGCCGISALAGDEVLLAIIKFVRYLSNHPQKALALILRRKD